MNRRLISIAIHGLQFIAGIIYVIGGWKADRALDKSGIGDPEIFNYWNHIAGLAFWIFVMSWVLGSAVILWQLRQEKGENIIKLFHLKLLNPSALGIWLPPALLFVGWVITIL